MRADSATVSVWSRNTTTVISDNAAASTASGASNRSPGGTGSLGDGARTSQQPGASAIQPLCGTSVAVASPLMATAAERRPSAIDRSATPT